MLVKKVLYQAWEPGKESDVKVEVELEVVSSLLPVTEYGHTWEVHCREYGSIVGYGYDMHDAILSFLREFLEKYGNKNRV